jgi:hypothetical protein
MAARSTSLGVLRRAADLQPGDAAVDGLVDRWRRVDRLGLLRTLGVVGRRHALVRATGEEKVSIGTTTLQAQPG